MNVLLLKKKNSSVISIFYIRKLPLKLSPLVILFCYSIENIFQPRKNKVLIFSISDFFSYRFYNTIVMVYNAAELLGN